jgi:hypothetical protein
MTSFGQIEANRRNALKSTGPKTETGKQRSRRNAVRHDLIAETIVEDVEDPEDYKAFEASVTADYDVLSAVERELVLRLASLLWRLRRATAIETGPLQIQSDTLRETADPQTATKSLPNWRPIQIRSGGTIHSPIWLVQNEPKIGLRYHCLG